VTFVIFDTLIVIYIYNLNRYYPVQERCEFAPNRRDSQWLSAASVEDWSESGSHQVVYRKTCISANKSMTSSWQEFYRQRIHTAGTSTWKRWSAFRGMLNLSDKIKFHSNRKCCDLSDGFESKMRKIKCATECQTADPLQSDHCTMAQFSAHLWRHLLTNWLHPCNNGHCSVYTVNCTRRFLTVYEGVTNWHAIESMHVYTRCQDSRAVVCNSIGC